MKCLRKTCVALLCALGAASASADSVNGRIVYHNDVFYHSVVLRELSNLTVWTDSFMDGGNLDPILAVWRNGTRLAENDDYPYIDPRQSAFDSGVQLYNLQPGTYLFTVTMYDNFSNGTSIGAGWWYDGETPLPLANYGIDPYVTVNWAVNPVPEPSTWAMLAAGVAAVGAAVRRRRHV